ncbi:MAG TPA: glycosyltransferase family 9 protein, partial [Ktedonobacterales bacterium]
MEQRKTTNRRTIVPVGRAWASRRLPAKPRHILVGTLLPIGDTLMATPAIAGLRRRFPEAIITAWVSASNAAILEGNPDIDQLVRMPTMQGWKNLREIAHAVRELRAANIDLIINLAGASSMLSRAYLPTVPRMFLDASPWWFLRGSDERYRARHSVDQYFYAMAPYVGLPATAQERLPRLTLSPDDMAQAAQALTDERIPSGKTLITMHVGGDGFDGRKQWMPERFAAVGRALVDQYDAHILLVGGPVDEAVARAVAARMPRNAHLLVGQMPLRTTAALIRRAALHVGNDSAPMHMAAAVGTPAIGIFGPSNWEQFTPVAVNPNAIRVLHS